LITISYDLVFFSSGETVQKDADKTREGKTTRPPLEAAVSPPISAYFLTAQGFFAAQGFLAAHGCFAAQGWAIFFSTSSLFFSQAFMALATSGVNEAT
jgi:hypothetical protein